MRRIAVLFAAVTAALTLAGCGGSDKPASSGATTASTPAATATATATAAATTAASSGGDASTVKIAADPGGALKFTETDAHRQGGRGHDRLLQPIPGPARRRDRGQRRQRGEDRGRHGRRRGRRSSRPQARHVHVLLPGRRSPRGGHGGQARRPVVEDPLEVAPARRGACATRAQRTVRAARSGRCRCTSVCRRLVPPRTRACGARARTALGAARPRSARRAPTPRSASASGSGACAARAGTRSARRRASRSAWG